MATGKTQSKSAKGKKRDKNQNAFDDKTEKARKLRIEKTEFFIDFILEGCNSGLGQEPKAFFAEMINNVKNGEAGDFVPEDFYFLTKFCTSKKACEEITSAFCFYFERLFYFEEREVQFKEDEDITLRCENFKKAKGFLQMALPDEYYCGNLEEYEKIKKELMQKIDDGDGAIEKFYHLREYEINAYFYEFIKRANKYFENLLFVNSPQPEADKQQAKDCFREKLYILDDFFNTKAASDIRDSTLIQKICDYFTKNFPAFWAKREKIGSDVPTPQT